MSMPSRKLGRAHQRCCGPFAAVVLAGIALLLAPASSSAAIETFGSPLSVAATLNTSANLAYPGTNTLVPPSPEAPNGVFHTPHFGADTALWNAALARGNARVPAGGQALKVELEGCAQAARNGPPPLTQMHFQDLAPLSGGGARVNASSEAFQIPVCGQNGASGATVSTYEPKELCVTAGDYLAFNDDGGYVENVYRSGVPYQVLGATPGSTADSFLANDGTDNGAIFSPLDVSANEGFAINRNEELMMRVTLGTGPNASEVCPQGLRGSQALLPPVRVSSQTDGVNHRRIVAIAVFCRVTPQCKGVATLGLGRGHTFGRTGFSLAAETTSHLPIRINPELMALIRRYDGVAAKFTAVVDGRTVSQTVVVKIL